MKDWAGNEITVGDTLVIVRTKPFLQPTRVGFFVDGKIEWQEDLPKGPDHCWDILGEHEVVEHEEDLYLRTGPDEKGYYWNFQLPWMGQPYDITCIKGKSDNEQEYFLEYFKVKS